MASVWPVSKLSTESDGSRRELVENSVLTADADATKQFRCVGVGGVYWALGITGSIVQSYLLVRIASSPHLLNVMLIHSLIVSLVTYALPSWGGFVSAELISMIDGMLRRLKSIKLQDLLDRI